MPKFCVDKIFSYICGGDKPIWGELNLYAHSLSHLFKNSQRQEKRSICFKNFFRKCECIRSCYLSIFSNLLKKSFRKTTSKTWTRTLDLDSEKPGLKKKMDLGKPWPRKTWTLKNLDPKKPGSWKTWNKYRIKKYVWL